MTAFPAIALVVGGMIIGAIVAWMALRDALRAADEHCESLERRCEALQAHNEALRAAAKEGSM